MQSIQNDQPNRPYVIPLPESSTDRPDRRLSLPDTVYIEMSDIGRIQGDLSNAGQSSRSRQVLLSAESSRENDRYTGQHNENYVEDTIFYDPFEDRRIDVAKERQPRPTQLPLNCSHHVTPLHTPTNSPGYSSHLRFPGQRTPSDDGFRLTPLPVPDTPEPPPAYTEIDLTPGDRIGNPITSPGGPGFLPQSPGDRDRKLINCPFCRLRVYTLVVRESGAITHAIAVIVFCFCFMLVFCIYFMDWCKYKNHYCPNCNNLIGYEMPFLCTDMVYSKVPSQRTNITR